MSSKKDYTDDGMMHPSGDASMKKRRRRGRQEGKSSRGESNNDDIDWHGIDSKVVDRGTAGGSQQHHGREDERGDGKYTECKELDLHSLWINYNHSRRHSNAIFAFDPPACWQHIHGPCARIEYLKFNCGETGMTGGSTTAHPPPFAIPLHFSPNIFCLANLDAFTCIAMRIRERMIHHG